MIVNGPISTPTTPFNEKGDIEPEKIQSHIEWAASQGISGIFVLGTWGGFTLLTFEERKVIAEAFCRASRDNNIKCIVNTGTPCIKEARELTIHAESVGADAVASLIPYYHSSGGYYTLDHYRAYFNELTNLVDIPFYLYNNPRTTGVLLSPQDFVALVKDGLAGVKDGSKDVGWLMAAQALLEKEDVKATIILGNTTAMLYAKQYGLSAVTSGASVAFPKLSFDIFNSMSSDFKFASQLHHLLMSTRRIAAQYGNPAMVNYSLLKALDIPDLGFPRLPWSDLTRAQSDRLLSDIREIPGISDYI